MKKTFTIILGIALLMAGYSACKKDKTEYQPKGNYQPEGDYVTTGINNNTVQSYTFSLDTADWYYTDSSQMSWESSYTNSSMNLNGSVQVYIKNNTNVWIALPYSVAVDSLSYSVIYGIAPPQNKVLIGVYYNDTIIAENPGLCHFRIVTVPPASMQTHPNVDYKNYTEVKNTFGLQD